MIVYHGSTLYVENPLVGVCRDNLDFARAFTSRIYVNKPLAGPNG